MTDADDIDNWLELDRFAVYGLGRSGRAASRLLVERGKQVVASDPRGPEDFDGELEELPDSVEVVHGENTPAGAEAVVVSPGLEPRLDVFDELRERGTPFFSEVDLAFDACDAPILAITGTDGKTTTTSLLGSIAEASRVPSVVGGNIGTPLSAVVDGVECDGVVVAEVSAFQLWSCHHLRPAVGGYTNIAGDHLDYFESRREYIRAKRRLERNASDGDWMVYNADDDRLAEWSREAPARRAVYGFEIPGDAELAVEIDDGTVTARRDGETDALFRRNTLAAPGAHNASNAMCAAAMALAFGLGADAVRAGIESFEPLPHRVEPVDTVDGVTFVNDSKATNVHSALAGLRSLESPYVAVVGGVDKGLDLGPLCARLGADAVAVVLIGAIADRLERELDRRAPALQVERADTLDEATRRAYRVADSTDGVRTVVLSPACSSFDMFESYEDRGEVFRAAVQQLRGAGRR